MTSYNIHITGVGGQGIGLLSQALLRAVDHAGIRAMAVDTHGLAQRGGVVVSRIRCGETAHSPLTFSGSADLVLGMEMHEALRSFKSALAKDGILVYLSVSWQPLPVRLGECPAIEPRDIEAACRAAGIRAIQVDTRNLSDARTQNMALLGTISKHGLVPGVAIDHYRAALEDLLAGAMLTSNMAVFDTYANTIQTG